MLSKFQACPNDVIISIVYCIIAYICAVDPRYREMVKGFWTPNGTKDDWGPYFEEIARRTVDAAKDHDKVVLSHATYSQECRDVVIETIVKGGEIWIHIIFVHMICLNITSTLRM